MRALRHPAVLTHAAVLAVLVLLFVLAEGLHDTPDANIGAGLVGLVIGVLGLPWSLVYFVWTGTADESPGWAFVIICAAALLNLLIHAALWHRHLRRAGRSS